MMVLYNNMLQGLFRSQILTLGVVFGAIMLMFLVLFRSWRFSTLGILPNLLSAALVLGLMGWARIPLDLMTVTIAAITIGIGVDNTIHYIHRYREELPSTAIRGRRSRVATPPSAGRSITPASPSCWASRCWRCRRSSRRSISAC
jgi:predicted RND superfamily exporter protein